MWLDFTTYDVGYIKILYASYFKVYFFWIQDLQNEIANKKTTPKKQTPQKKTPSKAGQQQFGKKAAGTPDKPSNAFCVIYYS